MGKKIYEVTPKGPSPVHAARAIEAITKDLILEQEVRLEVGKDRKFYVIVEVVNV